MNPAFQAIFWGFVSGGALVFGAAVGYFARVPGKAIAGVMAFGSGVLISVLSFANTGSGLYSKPNGHLFWFPRSSVANLEGPQELRTLERPGTHSHSHAGAWERGEKQPTPDSMIMAWCYNPNTVFNN
jgi:hypothetical protein